MIFKTIQTGLKNSKRIYSMNDFSHLYKTGNFTMVDVTDKVVSGLEKLLESPFNNYKDS